MVAQGVEAELVDFSDIVSLKTPRGLDQAFYQNLAIAMGQAIRQCGDKVPIITGIYSKCIITCLSELIGGAGYFGTIPGGLLDQVGRGYTDLCAALVAMGLSADELQVWKEVDGIFTADPRKVPTARLLSTITPAEAAELTFYGSEVGSILREHHCTSAITLRYHAITDPWTRSFTPSPWSK